MENLNAEQVKRGLECLNNKIDRDCNTCQIFWEVRKSPITHNCRHIILDAALALITSQEQRIKELTEENERLRKRSVVLLGEDGSLQVINLTEEMLGHPDPVGEPGECGLSKKCKADTVRKMQERLKAECNKYLLASGITLMLHQHIDQIAKEMLEGDE